MDEELGRGRRSARGRACRAGAKLKKHAAVVNRIVDRRWSAYRVALARRQDAIAVAEQRHLRALESAYVSALAAARTADARAASARAYAARVVAWAEAVTANGGSSQAASAALPSPAAPAAGRAKAASAASQQPAASGASSPAAVPAPCAQRAGVVRTSGRRGVARSGAEPGPCSRGGTAGHRRTALDATGHQDDELAPLSAGGPVRFPATVGARHRFRAMGVEVELLTSAPYPAAEPGFEAAQAEFERLEQIFSRFDPESELSRLNRSRRGRVSAELCELAAFALAARERTGGLVDATVHDALIAWGYDRTYAELVGRDVLLPAARPVLCGGAFRVDEASGHIELEGAARLDFGGLAKGYAVDRALGRLAHLGAAVVNAGGDLAVVADDAATLADRRRHARGRADARARTRRARDLGT